MTRPIAFRFLPEHWLADPALCKCSAEARGFWMDCLCHMHNAPNRGVLADKTVQELSELCRCDESVTHRALQMLKNSNAADIIVRNGLITIICRRMVREEKRRFLARNRVRRHRQSDQAQDCNAATKAACNDTKCNAALQISPKTIGLHESPSSSSFLAYNVPIPKGFLPHEGYTCTSSSHESPCKRGGHEQPVRENPCNAPPRALPPVLASALAAFWESIPGRRPLLDVASEIVGIFAERHGAETVQKALAEINPATCMTAPAFSVTLERHLSRQQPKGAKRPGRAAPEDQERARQELKDLARRLADMNGTEITVGRRVARLEVDGEGAVLVYRYRQGRRVEILTPSRAKELGLLDGDE